MCGQIGRRDIEPRGRGKMPKQKQILNFLRLSVPFVLTFPFFSPPNSFPSNWTFCVHTINRELGTECVLRCLPLLCVAPRGFQPLPMALCFSASSLSPSLPVSLLLCFSASSLSLLLCFSASSFLSPFLLYFFAFSFSPSLSPLFSSFSPSMPHLLCSLSPICASLTLWPCPALCPCPFIIPRGISARPPQ